MPRATVNITDTERFDLKTCPEGYVELRKMNYGEVLKRRTMAGDIIYKADPKNRRQQEAHVKMAQESVVLFEYKACIVDHNLEDDNGQPLNFGSVHTLAILDPKIGAEISGLIDDMNRDTEEDLGDLGNSPNGLTPVST